MARLAGAGAQAYPAQLDAAVVRCRRPRNAGLPLRQSAPKGPRIVDDGFAHESAAILEYLEDKKPEPRLFSADLRERATQRRLIREADAYFAPAMEHLLEAIAEKRSADAAALRAEIARWEAAFTGDFLAGVLSAADFTLYPMTALLERVGQRNPQAMPADLIPSRFAAWMARMAAMDVVQKTRPPHWK